MFLSRLVAALFVVLVILFVGLATILRDPADSATRLPAALDVQNIELAAEPFDTLAPAYADFDRADNSDPALTATRDLVASELGRMLRDDLNVGLEAEALDALVMKAVEDAIDIRAVAEFHEALVFGVPTEAPEENDAASDMAMDTMADEETALNVLSLSDEEQRLVNFGDAIGEQTIALLTQLQGENSALTRALREADLPALTEAIRPRLVRLQRVAYQEIEVETFVPTVEATGSTAANRRADVRARTGSPVAEIFVERGDYVEADQVLVRLENDGRDAQRLQALAGVAQAEANLISAQASIGSAAAQVNQALTSLDDALEAQSDILDLGDFASDTQRRNAASGVDQARQNLAVAQAAQAQAQAGLALADAGLESAQASLTQIDLDIARLTISAPFAGRIEQRHVELGSAVDPGQAVVTLADLDIMIATASVSDAVRQTLALGDQVSVEVGDGASAQQVSGPITLIDTTSSATTRTFDVEVDLTNTFIDGQPQIVDNQFATLTFNQTPAQVYRIPQSSLTSASIATNASGTTGLLTLDADNQVVFSEITFADYASGGQLLIAQDRLGASPIRLIVGRGGFVEVGDVVDGRASPSE